MDELQYETIEDYNCTYMPMEYLEGKFWLVGIFGTSMAIFGMLLNSVGAVVLGRLVWKKSSPLVYLFTLTMLDFVFMICYVLILAVQIYFDYFMDLQLYEAHNRYVLHFHMVAKVIQTVSAYLIVVASIERLMDVGWINGEKKTYCQANHRILVIFIVVFASTLFRGVSYWDIYVEVHPECEGFARYSLELSAFTQDETYKYYSFYAVNIIQVFLPFCLLLLINLTIVYRVQKAIDRRNSSTLFSQNSVWRCTKREANVKSAAKMLISVVVSYLLSNSFSLAITVIEHVKRDLLDQSPQLYTFSVDAINLLYLSSAATRFLIYVVCSEKIRQEVQDLFKCSNLRPVKSAIRLVPDGSGILYVLALDKSGDRRLSPIWWPSDNNLPKSSV